MSRKSCCPVAVNSNLPAPQPAANSNFRFTIVCAEAYNNSKYQNKKGVFYAINVYWGGP